MVSIGSRQRSRLADEEHRTALCFPMLSCVSYVRAGSCVFGGFGCGGDGHATAEEEGLVC